LVDGTTTRGDLLDAMIEFFDFDSVDGPRLRRGGRRVMPPPAAAKKRQPVSVWR
jgi:hypothetical protein